MSSQSIDPNPYYYSNCFPDWGYFPKSLMKSGSPYHKSEIYSETGYYDFNKESTRNKLSYIPILNLVVGIIRLMDACESSRLNKTRTKLQAFRGVCDIVLGPLNAIPDLIVTLCRMHIAHTGIKALKAN